MELTKVAFPAELAKGFRVILALADRKLSYDDADLEDFSDEKITAANDVLAYILSHAEGEWVKEDNE